jgi:hypothetical protein
MYRKLAAVLAVGVMSASALLGGSQPAEAQVATCGFTLGFQTLHDMIPDIVGSCRENEWHNAFNGDGLQQTTGGLLVWRKLDNWTAFTNGSITWINGPFGLQARPNTDRFPWEGVAAPPELPSNSSGGGSAGGGSTAPAPTATPAASAPEIALHLSDDRVDNGATFTVRLEATGDAGIDSMWWWATSTGDNDLRDTHSNNCRGATPCRRSWDVSTTDEGNITFHAKARDLNGNETEEVTNDLRVRSADSSAPTATPTATPKPTTTSLIH